MLRRNGKPYYGPVVFHDGSHYVAERHGKKRHRLLWDESEGLYRYWNGKGADHTALYHKREAEIQPGGEG